MLTCSTHHYLQYPLESVLESLQAYGIQKIELSCAHLPFQSPGNYAAARDVCAGYGIRIVGIIPDRRSSGEARFDPYVTGGVRESVDFVRHNVEAAKQLGAKFVTFAEGRPPEDVGHDAMWARLVRAFKEGAGIAADNGVVLVDEFHPGMLASDVESAPRILQEVDSPAFKGCVDFCHAHVLTDGDPVSMIEAVGEHLGHVHVADGTGERGAHVPLGMGCVDWRACLEAVKATGYNGEYSLCMHGYSFPNHATRVCVRELQGLLPHDQLL